MLHAHNVYAQEGKPVYKIELKDCVTIRNRRQAREARLFLKNKKRLLQFLLSCGMCVYVCVCVCVEDLTAAPVNEMLWKFHQLLLIRPRKQVFFFYFFEKFFFQN